MGAPMAPGAPMTSALPMPPQPPAMQPAMQPAAPMQPAPPAGLGAPMPPAVLPQSPAATLSGASASDVPAWSTLMSTHGGIKASLRRAFQLRIEPAELSRAETAALVLADVTDPHHQAYLMWRRSVLLVVALAFVPLTLLRFIEVLGTDHVPGYLKALNTLPVLAEGGLCALLWLQLRHWTDWRRQQRVLLLGWLVYFLTPLVISLYPLERAAHDLLRAQLGFAVPRDAAAAGLGTVVTLGYAIQMLLVLAPKVLSVMPGLMRAAIASKLLFPGSSAPGWLIVLGSPICALLVYVVLFFPYQVTGSGYFVLAMLGILAALLTLGRSGFALARPTSATEALAAVARVRTAHLAAIGAGALFVVIALARLADQAELSLLSIVTALLSLQANILLLTLIGADLVIANLERARVVSICLLYTSDAADE